MAELQSFTSLEMAEKEREFLMAQQRARIIEQKQKSKKKENIELAKKKALKKAKKKAIRAIRKLNLSLASSGVGIILVFFIMNAQLILGNVLNLKKIPKLNFIEMILLVLLDFLVLTITLLFIGLLVVAAMPFIGPAAAVSMFGAEILNFIQ